MHCIGNVLYFRFIRTARTYIRRYQDAENTTEWVKPLKLCVKQYNNTVSRVTGQKPADIMIDGEADNAAFLKMYGKRRPQPKERLKKDDPKVGDKVRLSRIKGVFDKEETGNYTTDYFTITDVAQTQTIPMFGLKDYKGKPIEGRAYSKELFKIYEDPEMRYNITAIHKKRKNKQTGVTEVLVSWENFPYKEWIPEADVEDI